MYTVSIEPLEPRTFLSVAPAHNLGVISAPQTVSGYISPKNATQSYRLSNAAAGNFNLTLSGLSADADVQLLDRRGNVLATSDKASNRTERISLSLKAGIYFVNVFAGVKNARTNFTLRLQADQNWFYAYRGSQREPIALLPADGSTRAIDPSRETWIVIHGMRATPDMYSIPRLAAAIDRISKSDQVLVLDWSSAAASFSLSITYGWSQSIGLAAAQLLSRWGIPGARVNLVGQSMGGYICDTLAANVPGGVDRIIALDPATDPADTNMNYANHSQSSLALIGSSLSTPASAATADEAFRVNVGAYNSTDAHLAVADLFASMVISNNSARPDRISRLFSATQIDPNATHPWTTDAYPGGFDGTIAGTLWSGHWYPRTLTYKSAATGQAVSIRA